MASFVIQIEYIETSAKQRTNVDAAFHDLVRAIRYSSGFFICVCKYYGLCTAVPVSTWPFVIT